MRQLEEAIRGLLSDKIESEIYTDEDGIWLDETEIIVKLEESESHYPEKIQGTTDKTFCFPDEDCRHCNKKKYNCDPTGSVEWIAELREYEELNLTYYVAQI